jgi:hypothetical protein
VTGDWDGIVVRPDGTVSITLTPEDRAEAEEAVISMRRRADEDYYRRHPNDPRSLEDREEDAWQAHFNGDLLIHMALCPYCGLVPDLVESRGYCCKLGRWLRDGMYDADQGEWLDRIEAAAARFGQAIANDDAEEADEAAAQLIDVTGTKNLEDAFVEAHLWPTPSCEGRHCFETPTRVWHAPNWCAEVDGTARDFKVWRDGGEIGPAPEQRTVEHEPWLLEGPSDEEIRLKREEYESY